MGSRRLTSEEKRAWARVTRSVRPLTPRLAEADETLRPPAPARDRLASGAAAPAKAPAVTDTRPVPANRGRERRVRRGQVPIAARFDLHGHTQASADAALPRFLDTQRQAGARCVLIITGKGRTGEGILRRNFLHFLESPAARDLVSGYAEAHPRHGGAGAFYVFLRRLET